jgi:hypothetical protein
VFRLVQEHIFKRSGIHLDSCAATGDCPGLQRARALHFCATR